MELSIQRCSTNDALQKAVLLKVFYHSVFLQWSKSLTKALICITDLISYPKHSQKVDMLNGLKSTLHF